MDFLNNIQQINENELQRLLLSKMMHLNERILNPPESIIEQILQIASLKIQVFNNTEIYKMILDWMRTSRNMALFRKNKHNESRNSLSRVAGAITIELLKEKVSWPLELLNIYLDDALGCRQWVDAPELAFLTKNLLEWTKYCDLSSPTSNSSSNSLHDDSSEEEEILDASTNSLITGGAVVPDVCDRYKGRHDEALKTVFETLSDRCGIKIENNTLSTTDEYTRFVFSSAPVTGSLMNAGIFLVNTMQTFCFLSPVRYLAAKCMSIWISNPALVEHVGRLLASIGQGLLGLGSVLQESDFHTIEALIKLRPSLKLSLAEVHRNILLSLAPISPEVTVLITRLHLMENTLSRGNKPDAVKLLLVILQSLTDTDKLLAYVPNHHCVAGCSFPESSLSGGGEYISFILGTTIRKIMISDIFSTVDPSDFKTLLEDCIKIIRHLGIGIVCPVSLFSQIYAYLPQLDLDPQHSQKTFSLDTIRFLSDFALSLQLLYVNSIIISDRTDREEKRQQTQHAIDPNTGGRTGNRAATAGRGSGRVLGRGAGILTEGSSMFRSVKPGAVIPGRGKIAGRGSTSITKATSQENETNLDSISGVKDEVLEKESVSQIKDNYYLRSSLVRELSLNWFCEYLTMLRSLYKRSLMKAETISHKASNIEVENPSIPESNHDDVNLEPETLDETDSRKRADSALSLENDSKTVESYSDNPSILTAISLPFLIDRLQQFLCCVNLQLSTKISLDIDKMATITARDYHIFTDTCAIALINALLLLCELDNLIYLSHMGVHGIYCLNASDIQQNKRTEISFLGNFSNNFSNFTNLLEKVENNSYGYPTYNGIPLLCSAVELVEHCIQKALRTTYHNLSGLMVEDISIIIHLFKLCSVNIINSFSPITSTTSATTSAASFDFHHLGCCLQDEHTSTSTGTSTNQIEIRYGFGYKEVYWKICLVCYLLGCSSPKTIGNFLWNNIPSVQYLLLMSITDRFYYPPTLNHSYYQSSQIEKDNIISYQTSTFQSIELISRDNTSTSMKNETINIKELQEKSWILQKKIKLISDYIDCDKFIKQEESYLWDYFFLQRFPRVKTNEHEELPAVGALVSDEEFIVHDTSNELINKKRNKKRNRSKGKGDSSAPPGKKKKKAAAAESCDAIDAIDDMSTSTSPTIRKSSRKHISRFNIQELFDDKDEEEDHEEDHESIGSDVHHEIPEEVEEEAYHHSESDQNISSDDDDHDDHEKDNNEIKKNKKKYLKNKKNSIIPMKLGCKFPDYSQWMTCYGVPTKDDLIFLPLQYLPRIPPDSIIKTIKNYNSKYKFGQKLRLSTEPDFLASSVSGGGGGSGSGSSSGVGTSSRDDILQSISWLIPAINAEYSSNILSRIPLHACIHILLVLLYNNCSCYVDYIPYDHQSLKYFLMNSLISHENSNWKLENYSLTQQDFIKSKEYSQDQTLCIQIYQKIFSLFKEFFSTTGTSNNTDDDDLLYILLTTMYAEQEEDAGNGNNEEKSSLTDLKTHTRATGNMPVSSSQSAATAATTTVVGEVIGLILKELLQIDPLRRSIARIVLEITVTIVHDPLLVSSSDLNFTNFFLSLPLKNSTHSLTSIFFQKFISHLTNIETDRQTFCFLLNYFYSHQPSFYPTFVSHLVLSENKMKLLPIFILEVLDISDPFLKLYYEIIQAINGNYEFGNLVTKENTSGSLWYSQFSIFIRNEFLFCCISILLHVYSQGTQSETLTSLLEISFCQKLFGNFMNILGKDAFIILPPFLLISILSTNNSQLSNFLVEHIPTIQILFEILDTYWLEMMSAEILQSILQKIEYELMINSQSRLIVQEECINRKEMLQNICDLIDTKLVNCPHLFGIIEYPLVEVDSLMISLPDTHGNNLQKIEISQINFYLNSFFDKIKLTELFQEKYGRVVNQEKDQISEFVTFLLGNLLKFSNQEFLFSSIDHMIDWILCDFSTISFDEKSLIITEICYNLLLISSQFNTISTTSTAMMQHFLHLLFHLFPHLLISSIWSFIYEKWSSNHPTEEVIMTFLLLFLQLFFLSKSLKLRSSLSSIDQWDQFSSILVLRDDIPGILKISFEELFYFLSFMEEFLLSSSSSTSRLKSLHQNILNSFTILTSKEILIAQRVIQIGLPIVFGFPSDTTTSTSTSSSSSCTSTSVRSLLYSAYLSFPEETIHWITNWIESYPTLPIKWSSLLENISQTKIRLKKRSNIVDEILILQDHQGKIWSNTILQDILLLFQLLMIEEGKGNLEVIPSHELRSTQHHHHHDSTSTSLKNKFYLKNSEKFIISCSFDRKFLSILEILEEPTQMIDSSNIYDTCEEFLLSLVKIHPAIFLRYQIIIRNLLLRSTSSASASTSTSLKSNKLTTSTSASTTSFDSKSKKDSDDTHGSEYPPPLPVSLPSKDHKGTNIIKNILWTASGAEINLPLWNCILKTFENIDPLILFLHLTTTQYSMDRVLETIKEYADRRTAFHGLLILSPPPNSDIDVRMQSIIKMTSEIELLKKIRKEKTLYRLLSVLETNTLELVNLAMYLPYHSQEEYL